MPVKPVSRQREWQLAMIAKGNCIQCGKPSAAERQQCDNCAAKRGVKKRHKLNPSDWAAVDWGSAKVPVIARSLGVSPQCARIQYLKHLKSKP